MKLSRRSFIGVSTFFAAAGGFLFSWLDNKSTKDIPAKYIPVLTSYLDTLIPQDDDFISASEAGVVAAFLEKANNNTEFSRLLENGCLWIETAAQKQYKNSFNLLSEPQRIKIIELAESTWLIQQSKDNLPGYFFNRTRDDAYSFYYQHPSSWAALNYNGPPQPHGFPDYSVAIKNDSEKL